VLADSTIKTETSLCEVDRDQNFYVRKIQEINDAASSQVETLTINRANST